MVEWRCIDNNGYYEADSGHRFRCAAVGNLNR